MDYRCPVCFYDRLPYPPYDFHICPCCGTEFENDDVEFTYDELRYKWVVDGAHWFFGQPPAGWNPWVQLSTAGYGVQTSAADVRKPTNKTKIHADGVGFELQLA